MRQGSQVGATTDARMWQATCGATAAVGFRATTVYVHLQPALGRCSARLVKTLINTMPSQTTFHPSGNDKTFLYRLEQPSRAPP